MCKGCKRWFHLPCTDIDTEVYQVLSTHNSLDKMIWCCPNCKPKVLEAIDCLEMVEQKICELDVKLDKKINTVMENINTRLSELENRINTQIDEGEKISQTFNQVKQLSQQNNSHIEMQFKRVKKLEDTTISQEEKRNQEKRKRNLIFYNIPESDSSDQETRFTHDCTVLKDIFARKNKVLKAEEFINVIRLRKKVDDTDTNEKPKGPPPTLVRFATESYKKEILNCCHDLKYLKDNLSIPIHYSLDLTPNERVERRKLVDELNLRRNNGEENIGIRNKKIVELSPSFRSEVQRSSWADLFKTIF